MSGSSERQRLHDEIEELRDEMGATVQELVHKADVPTRARERAGELKEEAVERGIELRDRTVDAAERAREAAGRAPSGRWAMLAGTAAALLTLAVIVRRARAR